MRHSNIWRVLVSNLVLVMVSSYTQAQDEYTVELYDTYCKACHATQSTGAPQAHDQKEWQARLKKKGLDKMVNNAITGIANMPAQGGCQECGYEDFVDLVNFMLEKTEK